MKTTLIILLLSLQFHVSCAVGEDQVFRGGAAKVDVTPQDLPVIVNGGMFERRIEEINDPLFARAVVLDDGETIIAIVLVDSCMMPRELLDRAKRLASQATGIPTNRILISATHCHSAPSVFSCLGSSVDVRYAAFLPGRIVAAIEQAYKNLEPARIGWAMGRDDLHVATRRWMMTEGVAPTNRFGGTRNDRAQMHPGYKNAKAIRETGLEDPEIPVISLQAVDGRQIAVMCAYSLHYVGAPNISADYFGIFEAILEAKLASGDASKPAIAMLANGTSGDTYLRDYKRDSARKTDRQSVAEAVSAAALKAFETIEYQDWVPLAMEEKELELDVRFPTDEEVAEATDYVKPWADRKPKTSEEVYALETIILSKMPKTRHIQLQAIGIGSLGIVGIPNEVFAETGLNIKKYSPFKMTYSISLANGAFGYIPPPEQHVLGGYTTWRARSSCLEVYAEPKIKFEVLKMLERVKLQRPAINQ